MGVVATNSEIQFRLESEALKAFMYPEVKSKTRYLTFEFKDRQITLVGKNSGNKIETGYSVYC